MCRFTPRIRPRRRDTTSTVAPAVFRARNGTTSSTFSKPSAARAAILRPLSRRHVPPGGRSTADSGNGSGTPGGHSARMTDIEVIRTAALGDSSYLLVSGEEAAVVDPQRDAWPLVRRCINRGLRLRYTVETHVHNDYVSGAREWQASTGATIVGPARAGYEFPYAAVDDGDEITFGDVTLQAFTTPGHTPEHTAYLLFDAAHPAPVAVFTGGSLMVGGAGRTDLLGADRADELTRKQCASLRRLLSLDPDTPILPTHGAGSFCAAPTAGAVTSTLGAERLTNPALDLLADEEAFVRARLEGLPRYPAYYRFMAPVNRSG